MTATSKHIVKQQILDLTVSNLVDEAEVSAVFSEVFKNTIESIIDEVCAELVPHNQVIRIDSLELNLGSIDLNKVDLDFPRAIKCSIKEEIYRHLRDGKVQSWVVPPTLNEALNMPEKAIIGSKLSTNKQDRNDFNTNRESVLFYYLISGLIPWHYEGGLSKLKADFSRELPVARKVFRKHLWYHSEILRAIYFFDSKIIEALLLERQNMSNKRILADFKLVKDFLNKLSESSNKLLSEGALDLINSLAPKKELFLITMAQLLTAQTGINFSDVIGVWPEKHQNQLVRLFQEKNVLVVAKFTSEEKKQIQGIFKEIIKLASHDEIEKTKSSQQTADETIAMSHPIEALAVGESLAINNAGLILVWPYLQTFFTGLNLMRERSFINDEMSRKAVHLLHYLVFKLEEGDETMWLLNKLLCGLDQSEFIPDTMDLNTEEMEECENLLDAVIKNWPVLKNTGPDSLRNTFLQREGLLVRKEGGWILKIERQAFDVLIDRLNWTISTIKLPWNNFMIYTEW